MGYDKWIHEHVWPRRLVTVAVRAPYEFAFTSHCITQSFLIIIVLFCNAH